MAGAPGKGSKQQPAHRPDLPARAGARGASREPPAYGIELADRLRKTRPPLSDKQIRRLAADPKELHPRWKALSPADRERALQAMEDYYGRTFRDRFASYTERPNLAATPDVIFGNTGYTAKELLDAGYQQQVDTRYGRQQGNTEGYRWSAWHVLNRWVHPSGLAVFGTLEARAPSKPPAGTKPTPSPDPVDWALNNPDLAELKTTEVYAAQFQGQIGELTREIETLEAQIGRPGFAGASSRALAKVDELANRIDTEMNRLNELNESTSPEVRAGAARQLAVFGALNSRKNSLLQRIASAMQGTKLVPEDTQPPEETQPAQ